MDRVKIVVDKTIPFIEGVFEPYADVVYLDGSAIDRDSVLDADALIIRTRTRCDRQLLKNSTLKIIATVTMGMDNIDLDYCSERGIFVQNALGCTAGGVMNYVFSALYGVAARKRFRLDGATMGIIGLGHTGRRVESMAISLGIKVLRCDTLRAEAEGPQGFSSLEEVLEQSDIVTMHLPLNARTRGMANADFFSRMKEGAFFINTSRGEIVDEQALKDALPRLGAVIIDAWNNEPNVDKDLIEMADIATPHIAGYSYQGKQNGTSIAVRTVAHFFGFTPLYEFYPAADVQELEAVRLDIRGKTQGEIASLFQYNYPIFTDDFMFRLHPDDFESLRANYRYRREFFL